jgi:hypothetical protein
VKQEEKRDDPLGKHIPIMVYYTTKTKDKRKRKKEKEEFTKEKFLFICLCFLLSPSVFIVV